MDFNMARHWSHTHLLLAVFSVTLPAVRQDLLCYSCHLEPGQNVCADANFLMKEQQRYNNSHKSDFIAKCEGSNQKCVIETIIDGDKFVKLMYRDCSDGSSFSTNVSGSRLERMASNNQTHCAYRHEILASVCISVCDENLCNGPQLSNSPVIGWYHCHVLMVSVMANLLCFVRFR